jgi:hypothetical protein
MGRIIIPTVKKANYSSHKQKYYFICTDDDVHVVNLLLLRMVCNNYAFHVKFGQDHEPRIVSILFHRGFFNITAAISIKRHTLLFLVVKIILVVPVLAILGL